MSLLSTALLMAGCPKLTAETSSGPDNLDIPSSPSPNPALQLESPVSGSSLNPNFVQTQTEFKGQCGASGQDVTVFHQSGSGALTEVGKSICLSGRYSIPVRLLDFPEGNVSFQIRHLDSAGQSTEIHTSFHLTHPGLKRFASGFEFGVTEVLESGGGALTDIRGSDSTPGRNSFTVDLESAPLGAFSINYESGNATQRSARLVPERDRPDNRVLRYILSDNNVLDSNGDPLKGRIQATMNNMGNIKEFYYKVRMRLGSDFEFLTQRSESMTWLTVSEFWNDGGWLPQAMPPELKGFRISVSVAKPAAGPGPLRFLAHGQWKEMKLEGSKWVEKWHDIWSETNNSFAVPINHWMTVEYFFKEGDATGGRFVIAVQPDGGSRQILLAATPRLTQSPNMSTGNGLNHLHPLKLYTGKYLLTPLKTAGKSLMIEWDDLEIWTEKNVGSAP